MHRVRYGELSERIGKMALSIREASRIMTHKKRTGSPRESLPVRFSA